MTAAPTHNAFVRRGRLILFLVCAVGPAAAADFTFAPNVSGGFGHYHWDVQIGSAASAANPDLTISAGVTYTFQANTSAIHPFWIKTAPSTGSLNAYNGGGLSANGVGAVTTITFAVPADATGTLYYDCGNHIEMHGAINVIPDPIFNNGFDP
jgi:plastocyanin